jgi:hypothetical protein
MLDAPRFACLCKSDQAVAAVNAAIHQVPTSQFRDIDIVMMDRNQEPPVEGFNDIGEVIVDAQASDFAPLCDRALR